MQLDPATRIALEQLYSLPCRLSWCSRALGKPCPVQTRAERRSERSSLTPH